MSTVFQLLHIPRNLIHDSGASFICQAQDVPAIINLSHVSCTRYILPSENQIYPINDENRVINGVILKGLFLHIQIMSKENFNIHK